ncbi:BSD domain-containing protein 1-like isoform X2 [Aricia agestis]|uniref:BSD domain-containing protein 1-like isoform X2 n=1 Tax=Aricia agestis TaxID=91739 RepID=UPI001C204C9D|nr:BSD domain-containing protein 1-like isoform X2 [Aricia agestis]
MAEKAENSNPSEDVQEKKEEEKPSGNWWDSWISSAKSKSAEVYSMVKKDLDEIGTAVRSEASHVINSTSNAIGKTLKLDEPESTANVMKKSLSSFIGQVSTVLNPEPDDEDDTEVILSSGDTTMLSTYKKELEALQRVDATYIVPANSPEFDAWKSSLEDSENVITSASAIRRLQTNPVLKSQYEKLVPDAVSHEDFWERYLFRVALLQDRLAAASRKQPLEEPTTDPVLAHLPVQGPIMESPKKVLSGIETPKPEVELEKPDVEVAWEDDFANDVELTEEQQILLLEEYEREIASKKNKTKDITNNNEKTNKQTKNKSKTQEKNKNENIKHQDKNKDKINRNVKSPKSVTTQKIVTSPKNVTSQKNETSQKNVKSPKKADECGNLVEDYFGDKEVKDDASANSDESWEKEFEIEETGKQKA